MGAKVLIVEDHADFRQTVRGFLEAQSLTFEIREAASAERALQLASEEPPEVVLMDIRLPGMNGIDAAAELKSRFPGTAIIALTMFEAESFRQVLDCEQVSAYIGKSELYEKLMPAITAALSKSNV